MKCPNCGSTLTCGCQIKKTADGKTGCSKCISTLESSGQNSLTKKVLAPKSYTKPNT